jgi:hypothetical protein
LPRDGWMTLSAAVPANATLPLKEIGLSSMSRKLTRGPSMSMHFSGDDGRR